MAPSLRTRSGPGSTLPAVATSPIDGLDAVIFDFDGTLADTEWPIFERARAAAASLGAELTAEMWSLHAVGVSHNEGWWDELGPKLGLSIDQDGFDEVVAGITHIPTAMESAEIAPGAEALVVDLHAAGVPLAVASGSSQGWLEHHLDRFGLRDRFATLAGRDHPDVRGGKPRPDVYLAALADLGVAAERCVAVEDTHRGIASARAAGLGAVVAVPSRLTVFHDLSAADLVVDSLAELDPQGLRALI